VTKYAPAQHGGLRATAPSERSNAARRFLLSFLERPCSLSHTQRFSAKEERGFFKQQESRLWGRSSLGSRSTACRRERATAEGLLPHHHGQRQQATVGDDI